MISGDVRQALIATASGIAQEIQDRNTTGQINLFTGEIEPPKGEPEPVPEERWLFDPDFRLVLPEDRAGKEIVVEEGVSLSFSVDGPIDGGGRRLQRGKRGQGTGYREQGTEGGTENRRSGIEDYRPQLDERRLGIADHESQIENPTGPLIFGKRPFVPSKPRVAKAEDLAQVIISGFGVYLGKRSERLQVKISGKVAKDQNGSAYEFPFFRISEVVIASRGVSISSDLIEEFGERGIRLSFIDRGGRPYAMLTSPTLTATVESRREQLKAFDDARGLEFARAVVRGKIRNQRHLLLYCGKYLKQANPGRYETLAGLARQLRQLELQARRIGNRLQVAGDRAQETPDDGPSPGPSSQPLTVSDKRAELMGTEGVAARLYWEGFKLIVKDKAEFMGREHRGTEDPLNALLNYGYGILYGHVWGAVAHAGLEPFAGFLHVDRPGKPSLVLDLVEEFRQPVVDRTVIAFVNLSQKIDMTEGLLDEDTRRAIAEKVLERLGSAESYRGRQYQIRSIIQMQARALVSFLRGKAPYKPFSFRW